MTVIMAINDQVGWVYHEIVWGGVNAETFRCFMEKLCRVVGEDEEAVVIMDNAPAHRRAEELGPWVRKLPPHSPFLNPIENCFSIYKAEIKQRLSLVQRLLDDRRAANNAGYLNIGDWRKHILADIAEQSVFTLTQEKVAAFYQRSQSFLGACLARQSISFVQKSTHFF